MERTIKSTIQRGATMRRQQWLIPLAIVFCLQLAGCTLPITITTDTQASPVPETGTPTELEESVARFVFDSMNNARADNNLPAYEWDENLARAARAHNFVMADHNKLSHQLPGEPELGTRLSAQQVQWMQCGENVAYYQPVRADNAQQKAEELHLAMLNQVPPEDGHRRNKLSPDFERVGISVYLDPQRNLWMTENYAA